MSSAVVNTWRQAFFREIENLETATKLRESALTERLTDWTALLTSAVVSTCVRLGWRASAKAHKLELLPVQRSEYLGLDVVAFSDEEKRWRFPVAVFELEMTERTALVRLLRKGFESTL